jgi:hypothetical protein
MSDDSGKRLTTLSLERTLRTREHKVNLENLGAQLSNREQLCSAVAVVLPRSMGSILYLGEHLRAFPPPLRAFMGEFLRL